MKFGLLGIKNLPDDLPPDSGSRSTFTPDASQIASSEIGGSLLVIARRGLCSRKASATFGRFTFSIIEQSRSCKVTQRSVAF